MDDELKDMDPIVRQFYERGKFAGYNEYNPFSRCCRYFYYFQAGFYDAWGEFPKERAGE